VVLEQDAVVERPVPTRDLALGLGMQWCLADMTHARLFEPVRPPKRRLSALQFRGRYDYCLAVQEKNRPRVRTY